MQQQRNRTLERLAEARERMERDGKLLLAGYNPPGGMGNKTLPADVRRTWRRAGWQPTREAA